MSRTGVLAWKARRDIQWLVLAGLIMMVTPSVTDLLTGRKITFMTREMMFIVGPLLAVMLGVVLTAREFSEPTLTFWSSRPISKTSFMLVRYVVGLVGLWMATALPVLLEGALPKNSPWTALFGQLPIQTLLFTIAFTLGCVVRQIIPAAMMSLAAGLLLYFAPLLVPGLKVFEVFGQEWRDPVVRITGPGYPGPHLAQAWGQIYVDTNYLLHLLAVLPTGLIAMALCCWAAKRDLTIRADQKVVAWSLGVVALLLFAGASRDLGSLDVAHPLVRLSDRYREEKFLDYEVIKPTVIACETRNGQGAVAITRPFDGQLSIHTIDVNSPEIISTAPIYSTKMGDPMIWAKYSFEPFPLALSASGTRAFMIDAQYEPVEKPGKRHSGFVKRKKFELLTLDLRGGTSGSVVNRLDITSYFDPDPGVVMPAAWGNALRGLPDLYVNGNVLVVLGFNSEKARPAVELFDVSNPDTPAHVTSHVESSKPIVSWVRSSGDEILMDVANLPGLTPLDVLTAAKRGKMLDVGPFHTYDIERDVMYTHTRRDGDITAYKLEVLHNTGDMTQVRGKRLATYRYNLMARVFSKLPHTMTAEDGVLYVSYYSINRGVQAFDVSNPEFIRSIASWSMPLENMPLKLSPIGNDRAVAAGNGIYVVKARE